MSDARASLRKKRDTFDSRGETEPKRTRTRTTNENDESAKNEVSGQIRDVVRSAISALRIRSARRGKYVGPFSVDSSDMTNP
jgi:hypothetical protein